MTSLTLYTPAGALASLPPLNLAAKRLKAMGFDVSIDASARARHQRFAGDDETRLAAIHRVASESPDIALATRGGYGMTRLLDRINWSLLAKSIERGTRWVGHSDLTALHLGVLAYAIRSGKGKLRQGAQGPAHTWPIVWAGPLACEDFGRADDAGGIDATTRDSFLDAMNGSREAIGFRTDAGFDGLHVRGTLWGGNLCLVNSLIGTQHLPNVKGGILFLEDVNEHPYRIERSLLQLHQAGVLVAQKAIILGDFTAWHPSPLDRGFGLKAAVRYLRGVTKTPVLTGLPFGHGLIKATMPVGRQVEVSVKGRQALLRWNNIL